MPDTPAITAAELARRIGGTLTGDGARLVHAVATLADAGPDDLAWLGHAKYQRDLATSRAGVVLVPPDCEVPPGPTIIRVPDPDLSLCEVLRCLTPPVDTVPAGVHPSACVAPDATVAGAAIGPHVVVGPGTTVEAGTQLHAGVSIGSTCNIGRDCVLWPNVVVREHTTIGDRVIIHPNVTIGADGFGYHQRGGRHHKIPQIGRVVIEDDVEIGAGTCIDRARSGVTRIGRGTKIDNLVQIGHNAHIGEDCIIVALCGISGSATFGNHVMMGGKAGVGDHVHVGQRAVVAAMSAVEVDVPDGAVVRGLPAVAHRDFVRQGAAVRRLPKMIEQLRDLIKRVEKLESTNDHPA